MTSALSPLSSKPLCRSSAEVSVVAARAAEQATVECFDLTENEHRDHILKVSRVPAAKSRTQRRRKRGGSPKRSRIISTISAFWRWKCSCWETARSCP